MCISMNFQAVSSIPFVYWQPSQEQEPNPSFPILTTKVLLPGVCVLYTAMMCIGGQRICQQGGQRTSAGFVTVLVCAVL